MSIASCCWDRDCSVSDDRSEAESENLVVLSPEEILCHLRKHLKLDTLIEIVVDLDQISLARFLSGDYYLSDCSITFRTLNLFILRYS